MNGALSFRSQTQREIGYAAAGMLLGIMAPVGWSLLHLLLFGDFQRELIGQVLDDLVQNPALYLYMGFGTMLVLGTCGFFIGRATQQIHDRAQKLDRLHREVDIQKQVFERRFTELNNSIKNFHVINMDLQRSVQRQEIINLAASGLHEVIGYDRVNVLLVDEGGATMQLLVGHVDSPNQPSSIDLPCDERAGCIYKAIRDRQVLFIEDITRMPPDYHLKPPFDALPQLRTRSFIICPIIVRGKAIGVLGIDNKMSRRSLDDTDVDTIKLFADQVAAALNRLNLLNAVESLTRELEQTFNQFLKYRDEHNQLISALRNAAASTRAATGEISGGAGVVQSSVDATGSAVAEISGSIENVAASMRSLNEFMERSIAAMTEIQYTVGAVDERTVNSQSMSEKVKSRAEHGVETVALLLERMRGIATSVEQTEQIIQQLSAKGEEVGSVTSVVAGLTQKTSLLALNAAIIAAQAGEHGRSFAVVADEVRSLSQEAAAATEKIEKIIDEMHSYTRRNVEHISRTRILVGEGLAQGEDMAGVLAQILDSSHHAMTMAHEIRISTQEIARAVSGVSRSIEELGEMSAQVSHATREELSSARSIVTAIEDVRSMTDEMVRATARQTDNAGQIDRFVDQVSSMASRIFDEMEARRQGSQAVIEDLQRLKQHGVQTGGHAE